MAPFFHAHGLHDENMDTTDVVVAERLISGFEFLPLEQVIATDMRGARI